jgi:formylglycine-generating enzyme required for sulfatase activity
MVSPKDGMVMVFVPEGEFLMGSTDRELQSVIEQCVKEGTERSDCKRHYDDELPQHRVYLDAYWIDQSEVSNGMYARCVAAGACDRPVNTSDYNNSKYRDHPVVYVKWSQAQAYCKWAGRQLPSEAQWEKAARGTQTYIYPWGNNFDCAKGNFDDEIIQDSYVIPGGAGCDGYDTTAPVNSFVNGASPYGVLNMAGNVWEWVADWYDEDFYTRSSTQNPSGPSSGELKVFKGGSWFDNERKNRSPNRGWGSLSYAGVYDGFRCADSP